MSDNNPQSAYINAAIQVALILALVSSVTSIVNLYMTINSEPTGSPFDVKTIVFGLVSCLYGIGAGIFSVKMYLKNQDDKTMKLGQGALIGLYTGVFAALFGFILGEVWAFLDPEMYQNYLNAMLDNYEAIPQMPAEALSDLETNLSKMLTTGGRASSLLYSIPIFGIITALSGMIGVKFFAETPEEL